jgi:exosortase
MPGNFMRLAGLVILIGLAYAYTWYWLFVRWSAEGSFFGHGFLIPLVFLWLILRRKDRLAGLEKKEDYRGLLLIVPALMLHHMAVALEVYSPSGFTLPVLLAGLVLYLWGWEMLKALRFPLFYLFFAIPLPMNWVHTASFKLKIVAVSLSTGLAGLLGSEIVEKGSYIYFSNGDSLLVGSPCSGLRSLVALVALGVLYAFEFTAMNGLGRMTFILFTVPIAMISNVLRITFLCLVADHWGSDASSGWVHDGSGYAIYLIALLLMIGCGRLFALLPFFKRRVP